jgi:peptide/nickel transport system substrate-binding protein
MNRLSRRQVLGGAAAAAAAVTLGAPSVCAQKGRQTLRFVVEADLKVFDPVWTTAYITRNHGYLVYDTLFGTDENLRIKPQMVKYTFLLRDGLRWHDGPPVHSERLRGVAEALGKAGSVRAAAHGPHGENRTSRQEDVHARARRAVRSRARGAGEGVEQRAFMMPARIASTPVEEQITELVGSGPFKVANDEWKPGDQVVYVRKPDYIPRNEVSGRFLYLDQDYLAYVSTKAGAVRFSTPVDLRRQLAGVARGTPITITYKRQEGGRKLVEVTTS